MILSVDFISEDISNIKEGKNLKKKSNDSLSEKNIKIYKNWKGSNLQINPLDDELRNFIEEKIEDMINQSSENKIKKIRKRYIQNLEQIKANIKDYNNFNNEMIVDRIIEDEFVEKIDERFNNIHNKFDQLQKSINNRDKALEDTLIEKIEQTFSSSHIGKIEKIINNSIDEKLDKVDIVSETELKRRTFQTEKEESPKIQAFGGVNGGKNIQAIQAVEDRQKIDLKEHQKSEKNKKQKEDSKEEKTVKLESKKPIEEKAREKSNKIHLINKEINVVEINEFEQSIKYQGSRYKIQKTMKGESLNDFRENENRIKKFFSNRDFIIAYNEEKSPKYYLYYKKNS